MSVWHNGSVVEGSYDKRRTSTKSRRWRSTGHCDNQAKKIHWACTTPPDVKTRQPSNRLDSRGRMQKMGQAKAETWEQWVSVAVALMMKSEVLPATVLDGDNASPSVPAVTAGPKSKSTTTQITVWLKHQVTPKIKCHKLCIRYDMVYSGLYECNEYNPL